MSRNVVIVTHSEDITGMLAELRTHLESRGARVLRFDTDRFPIESQVLYAQDADGEALRFRSDGEEVRVGEADALWYRRARWAGRLPNTMEPQLRHGCKEESEALLRGVMAAAPCFVLDPPERVRRCGHKPWQQRLAREVGMATPRTLMTNDAEAARAFIASCPEGAIAKMLSAFPIFNEQGEEQVVFTTALKADHLEKLDGLRYSPMVFQERVRKELELRITVIGSRLFTAAVDSERTAGADVDWRERGVTLLRSWIPYTLPAETERQLARYMERIGMQYSAIDMIVEPGGRHVFLEANPAGECFWLQYNSPNFPLAPALADVLLDVPGARRVASA
ncbi:MAG: MvdD family ATP-grasp ribosomal peptide maturase [Polyangia bacterium]